ncbi:MAG: septum formation initiator family protein [Deltaproteobacteria bacterium]|nr:septum formation initiator family protein [Deltaproteobacteria bacterium]
MPFSAWLVLIGLLTFLWFWIFGSKGLYEMEQLRGLRQELLEEKTKLAVEKEQLETELKYLEDPEYQKHVIRRELGYIEDDEAVIQFHPKK